MRIALCPKPAPCRASLTELRGIETNLLAKSVRIVAVAIAVVAAVCATPAFGQGPGFVQGPALVQGKTRAERREEANSRSVTGLVTGADDMPASGAVIQLKDMRTLQVRSFITQADGTYHFYELKADVDYQLTARSGDATAPTKTLSVFDSRKEAILNFKLAVKK